ncbi:unnamed protein product, partial [Polarella glacialis]
MPTSLFAGLCLLGSATRLLDSSCAQQAPCERRLWAQMSKVRAVCTIPGAHLGRPRILMWPDRTCQHVGAEEARPKDNTNNDNNDLYAGLASMLVQRCRGAGLQPKAGSAQLPAQVQGGCPCAMDAALLDGAPSEHPWQVSAKVAGSGAKSCATSSCTSQVKQTQDLLQAALRTYIPAFMCRKRGQTSRRSLLQAARRTRCTADGPAPGSAPGRLLPIPPQSSQQLVCLGRARALQIAAPLRAQQIPPVSQFRFAEQGPEAGQGPSSSSWQSHGCARRLALACRPGQQAGQSQPLRRRSPLGQLNAGEEDRHRGIVVSSASLLFQAPAIAGTSEASASWHKLAQQQQRNQFAQAGTSWHNRLCGLKLAALQQAASHPAWDAGSRCSSGKPQLGWVVASGVKATLLAYTCTPQGSMSPRDQRPGAKVQRGMHELRHPPIQRFPSYPAPTSQ